MGFKSRRQAPATGQPDTQPDKPTTRASSRRAQAARENGKKGGRPRKERYFGDFRDIPVPPAHPVDLGHWMQRIIALDAHRMRDGRNHEPLSKEIRGYTIAMSKLLRPIILLAGADVDGSWWRDPPDKPPAADDPVAMAYWILRELALSLHACVLGQAHSGAKLRTLVSAYVKAIPPDTLYDARDKVMEWTRRTKDAPGPTPQPAAPVRGARARPIHV